MPRIGLSSARPALRLVVCVLAAGLVGAVAAAAAPSPPTLEGLEVLGERPGSGEQCLVCRMPIEGAEVAEVRYRGRRFFVKADMLGAFCAEPNTYFRQLEARGGLFDERAARPQAGGMGSPWFWFGLVVLAGLITGALSAYLAIARRRSAVLWFFLGLAGSLAALAALCLLPKGDEEAGPQGIPGGLAKVPTTRAPSACPHCGGSNHPAAAACSGCGHDLSPAVRPETAPA